MTFSQRPPCPAKIVCLAGTLWTGPQWPFQMGCGEGRRAFWKAFEKNSLQRGGEKALQAHHWKTVTLKWFCIFDSLKWHSPEKPHALWPSWLVFLLFINLFLPPPQNTNYSLLLVLYVCIPLYNKQKTFIILLWNLGLCMQFSILMSAFIFIFI